MRADLCTTKLMWAGREKKAVQLKHSLRTFYKLNQIKSSEGHMIKRLFTELGQTVHEGIRICV